MTPMSNRERMAAFLRQEPVDRVPFVQYWGMSGTNEEAWALVGRNALGILKWTAAHRVDTPNCTVTTEDFDREGLRGKRYRLRTPHGELVCEKLIDPVLGSMATARHYVQTPADYEVLLAHLRDMQVHPAFTGLEQDIAALGDDGLPLVRVNRTPFQQMWVEWVCIEALGPDLADGVPALHACLEELARVERDIFAVVGEAVERFGLALVDFPDNITAPMIGPARFRQYCLPLYRELGQRLAGTGAVIAAHMDGDLRPLHADIAASPVTAIDSFSPPPDNDNPLGEALALKPDLKLLINFPSSVHLASPERIYGRAADLLAEGGHTGRVWLQISENMPPGRWRVSYPQIARAIADFGTP